MHENLLMEYATLHVHGRGALGERLRFVRETAREFLATARVWAKVFWFEIENQDDQVGEVLREVFELWCQKDAVNATVAWGKWLLGNDRGKEAMEVVVRVRCSLKETERQELEKRWQVTLDEEAVKVIEE